jgi:hypothetical protein
MAQALGLGTIGALDTSWYSMCRWTFQPIFVQQTGTNPFGKSISNHKIAL